MGRRTKYFTLDAQRAAKSGQAQRYRQSEKYVLFIWLIDVMIDMQLAHRGKAAKSRANKRYYERKKTASTTAPIVHNGGGRAASELQVDIPEELLERGQKVLRASFSLADDEYGPTLGLWTSPYHFFPPAQYLLDALPRPPWQSKQGLWESRAAVLGVFQYAEVVTAATARYERWTTDPVDITQCRVAGELTRRVVGWTQLRESNWDMDAYTDVGDGRDLRELTLDWGAKLVCLLVDEWELCSHGLQEYKEAWEGKMLPWHRMVAQTKALYAAEV